MKKMPLSKYTIDNIACDLSKLTVLESVDSTNRYAIDAAERGAPDGSVILAWSQNRGRGRLGRSFYSPDRAGIYLSYVVRNPYILAGNAGNAGNAGTLPALLTAGGGVAASDAIEQAFGIRTDLKWVNDVMLNGKKAGGILVEGRFSGKEIKYAVIGIGINVLPPEGGFPPEIADTATALLPGADSADSIDAREILAVKLVNRLTELKRSLAENQSGAKMKLLDAYKKRTGWLIGKKVLIIPAGAAHPELRERPAVIRGIDDGFSLAVTLTDTGESMLLTGGEISLKIERE